MNYKEMWNTLYLRVLGMKAECDRKEKGAYYTIIRMMETIEKREKSVCERIERYLGKDEEE